LNGSAEVDLVLSAVAEHQKAKVADDAVSFVALGHLVALFEIVNDVGSVRAIPFFIRGKIPPRYRNDRSSN
jgi:hypothetical protein